MSVGMPTTKTELDSQLSATARTTLANVQAIRQLKAYLDRVSDADLTGMGYVQAEVNTMRAAVTAWVQLADIFDGSLTLLLAKNFRALTVPLTGVLY